MAKQYCCMAPVLLKVLQHLPACTVGLLDNYRPHLTVAGQGVLGSQAKDAYLRSKDKWQGPEETSRMVVFRNRCGSFRFKDSLESNWVQYQSP